MNVSDFRGDRSKWNEMASSFDCHDIHQSWEWGEMMALSGWSVERLVFEDKGSLRGVASALVRKKFGFSLVYVSRGPLCDYGDTTASSAMLASLKERFSNATCLKCNPYIPFSGCHEKTFLDQGFKPARGKDLFDRTIVVNLSGDRDELFARLRPRFRTYVKKASARCAIRDMPLTEANMEAFWRLHCEMSDAKKRGKAPLSLFLNFARSFDSSGTALMRFALLGDKPLAATILLESGRKLLYKWGAASRSGPDLRASHLLHWENIAMAKLRGLDGYDLGGVGCSGDGVSQFKEGFGGEEFRLAGEFDWTSSKIKLGAYELKRTICRILQ